ncbi:MAG: ion transporter [Hyphomicrobiaceae bacterium]
MVSDSETGPTWSNRLRSLQGLLAEITERFDAVRPWISRAQAALHRLRIWLVAVLKPLVRNPTFERFVTGLILVNAVTLGMETSGTLRASLGGLLTTLDHIIIAVFVFELAARMLVFGTRFWRDPWSVFDFLVVAVTLMPATDNLSVLRALRVIRALRLVSAIPAMRRVVNGLLIAIPGMSSIVVLLLLIFYVFSVMATNMYADTLPERFGTIGDSLLTLFQVMSLDGWTSEVARPVMDAHPWSWIFFLVFILITSFTVLNLFIGIIVDGMQQQHIEAKEANDLVKASRFGKLKTQFSVSLPKGPGDKAQPLRPTVGDLSRTPPPPPIEESGLSMLAAAPVVTRMDAGPERPDPAEMKLLLDEIRALRQELGELKSARNPTDGPT